MKSSTSSSPAILDAQAICVCFKYRYIKRKIPAKPNMGIISAGNVVVTQAVSKHFPLEHRVLRRKLLFLP